MSYLLLLGHSGTVALFVLPRRVTDFSTLFKPGLSIRYATQYIARLVLQLYILVCCSFSALWIYRSFYSSFCNIFDRKTSPIFSKQYVFQSSAVHGVNRAELHTRVILQHWIDHIPYPVHSVQNASWATFSAQLKSHQSEWFSDLGTVI